MIPHKSVFLHDSAGAITSTEKQILETVWPTSQIELYYMKCWQSTYSQLTQLDWQLYKNIYDNARSSLQVYIIKVLTGWLPVRHNINKMTNVKLTCPLCSADETIAHLYQCPRQHQWRKKFLQQMSHQLRKANIPATFRNELIADFEQLLTSTDHHHHFSEFKIFVGLLPKKWTEKREAPNNNTNHSRRPQWAKQFGLWLLQQGHELWLQRNTTIHDKERKHSTMDFVLNQKIRHLYSLQEEISYHDHDLFSQPLEDRLQLTQHQKMTWITNTTRTMKVSMAEFQSKQTTGQRDIRQFFKKRNTSQ